MRSASFTPDQAHLPEGAARRESRRTAVDAALRMAEASARGTDAPPDESVVPPIAVIRDVGDGSERRPPEEAV